MKTTQELAAALAACKGGPRLAAIARHAGADYNHVTRIARGEVTPRLDLAVRLFEAIEATAHDAMSTSQPGA